MKLKILLDENETISEAEDFLEKSIKVKKECSHGEKYSNEYLNEMHDYIADRHEQLLEEILYQIELEIKSDAHKKRHI